MIEQSRRYRLGDRLVEPRLNRLVSNGVESYLEPKAMDVLVHLLSRPGEVVSQEELLANVWQGRIVEDGVVHQSISKIRRALDDDARHPQFLESVPRRGYRIVAPVQAEIVNGVPIESVDLLSTGRAPEPRLRSRAVLYTVATFALAALGTAWLAFDDAPPDPIASAITVEPYRLAVLPIAALTFDDVSHSLARALSQEIRRQYSRYTPAAEVSPGVLVDKLTSEELALAADYAISGTLQREDGRTLVKLELMHVRDGRLLWAQDFADTAAPADLQRKLAAQVVRFAVWYLAALQPGGWGPREPAAHVAFAEYMRLFLSDDLDGEGFWLERTLEIDPNWGEGWANLAWTYFTLAPILGDQEYVDRAREAAARAPPDLVDRTFLYLSDDLAHVENQLRQGDWFGYAWLLLHSGLYREAEGYFRWFVAQAPHHAGAWRALAFARVAQGDFHGAIEAERVVEDVLPESAYRHPLSTALALVALGRIDEAKTLHARIETRDRALRSDSAAGIRSLWLRDVLAFEIAIAEGDRDRALTLAEREDARGHAVAALHYLRLGDPRAAASVARLVGLVEYFRHEWAVYPTILPPELHDHPVYLQLTDALGFTDTWRAELCRRAATLPKESHITCTPGDFESVARISAP